MTQRNEIVNVRITSTMLGVEDHGILSAYLTCEWPGSGQTFGGYALDQWDADKKQRVGTAYGMEFIRRLLATVGVEKWEDLTGKYIRIEHTWSSIDRIGHITEDRWFSPQDDLKYLLAEKEAPR